jgi:hypothetical protein
MAAIGAVLCAAVAGGVIPAASAHAVTGTADTSSFAARLVIGNDERACSAALVDREWLLTAASCFAADPAQDLTVAAGVPAKRTTATIGRSDLASTGGAVRQVVELVPRPDRDVVLARLNRPVTNVTPVAVATAAPGVGEELKFVGFGRTKTQWAPLKLHSGAYAVESSTATAATVAGKNGVAACMGDSGGPVFRGTGASAQLVALNSQSAQGGCFGTNATQTSTAGVISRVDGLKSWIDSKTGANPLTDFNGDGIEDIVVSDPKATVAGSAGAGLLRVVYGGGKGTAQIDQNLDWVPGSAEVNDAFGQALATVDYNEDGYTDIVVGAPGEDLGDGTDAGMVDVLHGAVGGVGSGSKKNTHFEQGTGTGAVKESASEAGDRMGSALAAGTTAAGRPWILIGSPGEAVGTDAKAGMAFYAYDDTSRSLHQDLPTGVPGAPEAGDAFGAAVAGDANYFAIGVPGEAIGTDANSGTVALFSHILDSEGRPTTIGGVDQDNSAVSGAAEPGDEFGAALAMTSYRPSGAATATSSLLAIGSPGETTAVNGADKAEAGRAVLLQVNPDKSWTYLRELRQGEADDTVSGTSETGDRMGASLTAINTAPRAVGTAATMVVAVGTPGEAIGTATASGAIHTFSMLGAAGDNDLWIEAGDGDGIPGTPAAGQRLGQSIHFTGTRLYAGMPYGPSAYGALHALPIGNVVSGGTNGTVTTYQPGTGGLPAAGTDFGHAAR